MYNKTAIIIECAVFLPMLAAPVSYAIGRKSKDGRSLFADLITGLTFLLCGMLSVQMLTGAPGAHESVFKIPYVLSLIHI